MELHHSAQNGMVAMAALQYCLTPLCSQYMLTTSIIRNVMAPHQNPPTNRHMYIVIVQGSGASVGTFSPTPISTILILLLSVMMLIVKCQVFLYPLTPDIFWRADDSHLLTLSEPSTWIQQCRYTSSTLVCSLFIVQLTTIVLIACPRRLPSVTLTSLLRTYKCFMLMLLPFGLYFNRHYLVLTNRWS